MTALVAVANPTGIEQVVAGAAELAEIEVEQELARAKAVLGDMDLRVLPENGRRATRSAIIEELSKGVHVLYLVCHGRILERTLAAAARDRGRRAPIWSTARRSPTTSAASGTFPRWSSCAPASRRARAVCPAPASRAAHGGHGARAWPPSDLHWRPRAPPSWSGCRAA